MKIPQYYNMKDVYRYRDIQKYINNIFPITPHNFGFIQKLYFKNQFKLRIKDDPWFKKYHSDLIKECPDREVQGLIKINLEQLNKEVSIKILQT